MQDSAHFVNEQRKQVQVDTKVASLRERAALVSASDMEMHRRLMEQRVARLEASRDLTRIWIYVDMDAFFAVCEELANSALVGRFRFCRAETHGTPSDLVVCCFPSEACASGCRRIGYDLYSKLCSPEIRSPKRNAW